MAEDKGAAVDEAGLAMANALVGWANDRMEAGADPMAIAAAMRNATANFSAFARARTGAAEMTVQTLTEEFAAWLSHYDAHHQANTQPMTALERLVREAKGE